jgi:hypothetical protein
MSKGRVKGSKDKTKRIRRWYKKPVEEVTAPVVVETKTEEEGGKPETTTPAPTLDADKTETPAPVSTEGATA